MPASQSGEASSDDLSAQANSLNEFASMLNLELAKKREMDRFRAELDREKEVLFASLIQQVDERRAQLEQGYQQKMATVEKLEAKLRNTLLECETKQHRLKLMETELNSRHRSMDEKVTVALQQQQAEKQRLMDEHEVVVKRLKEQHQWRAELWKSESAEQKKAQQLLRVGL